MSEPSPSVAYLARVYRSLPMARAYREALEDVISIGEVLGALTTSESAARAILDADLADALSILRDCRARLIAHHRLAAARRAAAEPGRGEAFLQDHWNTIATTVMVYAPPPAERLRELEDEAPAGAVASVLVNYDPDEILTHDDAEVALPDCAIMGMPEVLARCASGLRVTARGEHGRVELLAVHGALAPARYRFTAPVTAAAAAWTFEGLVAS